MHCAAGGSAAWHLAWVRVVNLATIAFDIYDAARDQVARMRVDEVKRAHTSIVRRANLMQKDVAAQKAE